MPGIIDVARLKPGSLLVDYSFPNAFNPTEAIKRVESDGDILFTSGGQLTLPEKIGETLYLPDSVQALAASFEPAYLQEHPVRSVPDYGDFAHRRAVEVEVLPEDDAEYRRRLKALGYLD